MCVFFNFSEFLFDKGSVLAGKGYGALTFLLRPFLINLALVLLVDTS